MPPSKISSSLTSGRFICMSCRSKLRNPSPVAQWFSRSSSQLANRRQRLAPPSERNFNEEKDPERLKALEALGLLPERGETLVNYFEKISGGELRRLQNADEFNHSFNDTPGADENNINTLLQNFSDHLGAAKQLAKVIQDKEGLVKSQSQSPTEGLVADPAKLPPGFRSPVFTGNLSIPFEKFRWGRKVCSLNRFIEKYAQRFALGYVITPTHMVKFWEAYKAARPILRSRWHLVPRPTWDLLWYAFTLGAGVTHNRMSRIYTLAADMQAAGVTFRDDQQLLSIEAMFAEGWKDEALENHRRCVTTLGARPETFMEFWQLGLRMHCQNEDLERAERVVDTINNFDGQKDARFVLPLIQLYAQNSATADKAVELFRRMRTELKESITIEDYDLVITRFLLFSHTNHALVLFVDMMTNGKLEAQPTDQLPYKVMNAIFFGKWLKRLIGQGQLNAACDVIHLMQARGVLPAAIAVNGVIGALLRTETPDNVHRAEDMAWAMIDSRLHFVRERKGLKSLLNFRFVGGQLPRATLETFSILAERYSTQNDHDKMVEVWEALRESEMTPDTFILNHLLNSCLREGKGDMVQDIWERWSSKANIMPDSWTFMALWGSLPVSRQSAIPRFAIKEEIERTRKLFREMMKSVHVFSADGIDVMLARRVLHAFRKLDDQVGLLLAYRTLREFLGLRPPTPLALEIVVGCTNLEEKLDSRSGKAALLRAKGEIDRRLGILQKEMTKEGKLDPGEELPEDHKLEEISKFVGLFLEAKVVKCETPDLEIHLKEVAREMGLLNDDSTGASCPPV